jgi:uncharacterized tellurite resistance protein B-like protein
MDTAGVRTYTMHKHHPKEEAVMLPPRRGIGHAGLILAVLLLVAAGTVFARAGGGGSYGGSGGGGGSDGDGGGIGYLLFMLVRLAIEKPVIGVPLLVVVVILLAKFGRATRSGHETRTITRAGRLNREQEQTKMDQALAALTARDHGFTPEAFLTRAGTAFTALQSAWSDQELGRVRPFISDGINERFTLQVEMQRREGYRNRMENVSILSSRIVGVGSDRHFDTIHVEFTAHADDSDVDIKSGRVIRKNSSESFTEYWSFLRKPGVQTLAGKGLVEGFCPNCGTSLELTDTGRCGSCDSIVTSGDYDWVLAEITQSMEWNALSDASIIPGYQGMLSIDPGFNLQHIEDRTSVIFWRLMSSWFENSPSPARKVTLPEYLGTLEEQLRNTREGEWWLFYRDAAVGTVEVQSVTPGPPGGMDRVDVLVKWSASNARKNAEGKVGASGGKTIRPQVFTLARKHGVLTSTAESFRSSHCPGCGAPYEGGDSGACDYCGRPLNDGSQEWVLESIAPFSASRITGESVSAIRRAALVPPDLILASMISAMYADGEVDEKEMESLRKFSEARKIPDEQLNAIIETVKSGAGTLPTPSNPSEAREIMGAMARMVMADGKLSSGEQNLLQAFGDSQGMTWADVKLLLAQQKAVLFAEAKEAIRTQKQTGGGEP